MDSRHFRLGHPNPNNQYSNSNPYVNIPPPPLPPRFPPPNIPSMPPLTSFPPFTPPNHPPYPAQQLPPPRPVHSAPSWASVPAYPPSSVVNRHIPLGQSFSQSDENVQEWVDEWVKNKGKTKVVKNEIKVYQLREKLNDAFKLIRDLENSSRTLGVMVKTVSAAEWQQKCNEVEEKKVKLTELLNGLKLNKIDFKLLKEKLSKRTKKRARLRRQAERRKRQKEEEKVREQNNQYQIDNWQREMQEKVERVKREEELKKEADAVLWGVTHKKTEAKRQVAMLSALLTLRYVRVARLTASGVPVSQMQIDTFNTVIERLKNMWSRHLEECQLEEQALRGMLGTDGPAADVTSDAVKTHRRLVLNEWETAIVGCLGTLDSSLKDDELIDIRLGWDQFAVQGPSLLASTVPPGYVLPVPPSSDEWRSFLKY